MANQKRYELLRLTSVHRTLDIVFRDVPITVEFGFYEGHEGGPDEPPEYDYIEIDRVLVDEIDVLNLIGEGTHYDLLEALHKEVDKLKEESC